MRISDNRGKPRKSRHDPKKLLDIQLELELSDAAVERNAIRISNAIATKGILKSKTVPQAVTRRYGKKTTMRRYATFFMG